MSGLRFSANLGFLWNEKSFIDRIHAAHQAGFSGVECHFPYDTDPGLVRDALSATGLPMLSLNTLPGNSEQGDFGLAAVPGRQAEAHEVIQKAIDYAAEIGAFNVHVMAGICNESAAAMHTFYDNLAWASERATVAGVGLLIEPINRISHPGYALYKLDQAIDLVVRLAKQDSVDNLKIMFDCYHVQTTEGNLLARLKEALPYLGHIQIAAVPGRGEPTNCEINYPWLFNQIAELDYDGWIGAEYTPATDTDSGLGWYQTLRTTA